MCGVRLVYRVSTDVLRDRVDVVVKVKDIIQSRLRWYGHVMHGEINSQVMELEINGKGRKNNISTRTTDLVEYCVRFIGMLAFNSGGGNHLSAAKCPIIY